MPAKFDARDKQWLKNNSPTSNKLTITEESILINVFENETDVDVQDIEKQLFLDFKKQKEEKFLRKVALYKIVLFIPEYFLMRLMMFDKQYLAHKVSLNKLFLNFYRKKIDFKSFKKSINELTRSGKGI